MPNNSLDHILENLNPPQREAVTYGDGPLLIFAGAGSGKTRVLTHRIAYLLQARRISPAEVMAVTFTNKAANEMKERIERLVGGDVRRMGVGTFHAICARILRYRGEAIGVPSAYSIFDTDDQLTVVQDCFEEFNIATTQLKPNAVLNRISSAKNELITPEQFAERAETPQEKVIARIYLRYQERLENNHALDFDDLIMSTVKLFERSRDVLREYQERFRYLFVDEYQDINLAQYKLINLLAARSRNLCVVGDDDQSIYSWRGANSRLLLKFEEDYPDARIVKLEQNYRSPQTILNAAYHVISRNRVRKDKRLWTTREGGAPIRCYRAPDEHGEALFISRVIREQVLHERRDYRDFAVLYRVNAQSRVLEQMLLSQGIPYRIIGGLKFFARKEIKDIIAYMRVLYNPNDSVSLRRVINTPTRGIGGGTLAALEAQAAMQGADLYQVIMAGEYPGLSPRLQQAVRKFADLMRGFEALAANVGVTELTERIIADSGYERMLVEENSVQARTRLENIKELISATREFEAEALDDEGRSLHAFLEQVALISETDDAGDDNMVTLMTLHAAKGLEFPVVFMTGMEEGVFPLARMVMGGKESELEEERRLCYVGMTRSEELLYCTMAVSRMLFGTTVRNNASRFLEDIPDELIEGVEGSWLAQGTKGLTWEDADIHKSPDAEIILAATSSHAGPASAFRTGDRVRHNTFGEGLVLATQGANKVTVNFKKLGTKILDLTYAPLTKL